MLVTLLYEMQKRNAKKALGHALHRRRHGDRDGASSDRLVLPTLM